MTFVDLALHHQPSIDEPAAIQVRRLRKRRADLADLTAVDQVVDDLLAGRITRDEARDQVARIVRSGPTRRGWAVTLGWGVMGTGVALTLGGTPAVCILAFLAALAIDRTKAAMGRLRLPSFYLQAAGGFVATTIAVTAASSALEVNPSRVITAGIVMLLAGVGLMGATQDALAGFPVTASARPDPHGLVLDTAGIIAGVAAGLTLGFPRSRRGRLQTGCGGTRRGWGGRGRRCACRSGVRLRVVWSTAVLGGSGLGRALGQGVLLGVERAGLSRTWGELAAAAATIGAVCYLVARGFRVPPFVVVVPAGRAALPGRAWTSHRGLALLAEGRDGALQLLASALGTALALAAGVYLGQYIAQPVKREALRLESRLVSPRMIGPFHRRR